MADTTRPPAERPQPAWRAQLLALLPMLLAFAVVLAGLVAYTIYTASDDPSRFRLAVVPGKPHAAGFTLPASDGRTHSLSDYRGRVVVLMFGFTRCPEACPGELYKFSQVLQRLGAKRNQVQILMITLDPQRDTVALLRQYVTTFDPTFIGLSGTETQTAQVEADYGVISRRIPLPGDYTLEHSTTVYVIDASGRQRLLGNASTRVEDFVHDLNQIIS